MQGYTCMERPVIVGKLSKDVKKKDPRRIFMRATVSKDEAGEYVVTPAKNQSSGLFGVIQKTNCMAVMPEGLEPKARRRHDRVLRARRARGSRDLTSLFGAGSPRLEGKEGKDVRGSQTHHVRIVTCSDTRDLSQDFAGDALEKLIAEAGWVCRTHTLVKDERPHIAQAIKHCADDLGVDVVLTCGGAGFPCAT